MPDRRGVIAYSVLILSVLLGTFVRIHDISSRTLFSDESFSILRITSHTEADLRKLVDDRVHPVATIAAFQRIDAKTSPAATLASIGTEEPQRGPLYYGAANLWLAVGGTSIAGFRSLAVIFGILAIGAAYLFGLIAFRDRLGGAILASLVALSPFHIAYAEQVREYGLFTLAIFSSAAALLAAMRGHGRGLWVVFAAACGLGLLATPLFALVVVSYIGYAAYAYLARTLDRRDVVWFAAALVVAAVAVSPWYFYVARVSQKIADQTAWGATVYPPLFYLAKIAFEIGAVFFDAEFASLTYAPAVVVVMLAVTYLFYRCARTNADAFGFTLALAVPTALVLLANDVRSSAHFATIGRYATPVWIALEIAVAAGAVAGLRARGRTRLSSSIAMAILVIGGSFCALTNFQHRSWWDNNDNVPLQEVAVVVNAHPSAIVVAAQIPLALVLVHYLNDNERFQLYSEAEVPHLASSGRPNMLLAPDPPARNAFARRFGNAMRAALGSPDTSLVRAFHTGLEHSHAAVDAVAFEINSRANALWILP